MSVAPLRLNIFPSIGTLFFKKINVTKKGGFVSINNEAAYLRKKISLES